MFPKFLKNYYLYIAFREIFFRIGYNLAYNVIYYIIRTFFFAFVLLQIFEKVDQHLITDRAKQLGPYHNSN